MTKNLPDRLIVKHPDFEIDGLRLYNVSTKLPESPNVDPNFVETKFWRGYVATFQINTDCTFELLSFNIANLDGTLTQQTVGNGVYQGDFEISLRPFLMGPNTKIPVTGGKVEMDRQRWKIDDQKIYGWDIKRSTDAGFTVETEAGRCFAPNSLTPAELEPKLNGGFAGNAICRLHNFDRKRNCFLLRIVSLAGSLPNSEE